MWSFISYGLHYVWLKKETLWFVLYVGKMFTFIPVPSRKVVDYSSDSDISYDEY